MKPNFIDYRVRKDAALYREALAEIGGRHGLDVRDARADEYGVNTVFHLPAGEVVKLFTASGTAEHEAAVMQCLHQQAPGTAPRLLHTGAMAGLPYLVMSQLTGKALLHAWDELPRDAAMAVREQLGALLRRVHACALPATTWSAVVRENLTAGVTPSWAAYIQTRRERTVDRQREKNCPAEWLQAMPAFLDEVGIHRNIPARGVAECQPPDLSVLSPAGSVPHASSAILHRANDSGSTLSPSD